MPAVSKSQAVAAAIAKHHPEKAKGAAKEMAKSMSKEQLGHFAETPRKGLPRHVKKASEHNQYTGVTMSKLDTLRAMYSKVAGEGMKQDGDLAPVVGKAPAPVGTNFVKVEKKMAPLKNAKVGAIAGGRPAVQTEVTKTASLRNIFSKISSSVEALAPETNGTDAKKTDKGMAPLKAKVGAIAGGKPAEQKEEAKPIHNKTASLKAIYNTLDRVGKQVEAGELHKQAGGEMGELAQDETPPVQAPAQAPAGAGQQLPPEVIEFWNSLPPEEQQKYLEMAQAQSAPQQGA